MPAYALRLEETQEKMAELEQQLSQAVRECTEVGIVARNHVKRFLMEYGVWQLSELDYPLRLIYEDYVEKHKIPSIAPLTCLHTFDKMKLHAMREEMQTIAGRRKYELKYVDQVLFLPYYPKPEIAAQFIQARDKNSLVWDFTKKCSRKLKEQIFECLNHVVTITETWRRKEKLMALQYFYGYCIQMGIADIETITLEQEEGFRHYLAQKMSGKVPSRFPGIIEFSRKK